jgi:hypothetical protein
MCGMSNANGTEANRWVSNVRHGHVIGETAEPRRMEQLHGPILRWATNIG